jgi:hypothetical protein
VVVPPRAHDGILGLSARILRNEDANEQRQSND